MVHVPYFASTVSLSLSLSLFLSMDDPLQNRDDGLETNIKVIGQSYHFQVPTLDPLAENNFSCDPISFNY